MNIHNRGHERKVITITRTYPKAPGSSKPSYEQIESLRQRFHKNYQLVHDKDKPTDKPTEETIQPRKNVVPITKVSMGRLAIADRYNNHRQSISASREGEVIDFPGNQSVDEHEVNTASVRNLDDSEVDAIVKNAYEKKDRSYAETMMLHEQLAPQVGVEIDGKKIFVSGVTASSESQRSYAACYIQDGKSGDIIPRLMYRSQSDGGWRTSYGVHEDGWLDKGSLPTPQLAGYDSKAARHWGQYTQLTKPALPIVEMLEQAEDKKLFTDRASEDLVFDAFYTPRLAKEGIQKESASGIKVKTVLGHNLDSYLPGIGLYGENDVSAIELPDGFEPDFTQSPVSKESMNHTLLGECEVEVYRSTLEGQSVDWHVAHNIENDVVWLDRIVPVGAKVNGIGTYDTLILAGALNAKPLEYYSQLDGMNEGRDFNQYDYHYAILKPMLDRYAWVKNWREARAMQHTLQHAA